MNFIIKNFLMLPLLGRASIILFLGIFLFWPILGRKTLWILSVIPFLVRKVFQGLYVLIEIPLSGLHKKFGNGFYKIANQLSGVGEKIDFTISRWYDAWHEAKKSHLGKLFLIYILCVAFIGFPSVIEVEASIFKMGEKAYLNGETLFVNWLEEHGWYSTSEPVFKVQDKQVEENVLPETKSLEIPLTVSGVKSSLLVREVPSAKEGTVLDRLYNGDIVIWTGQLAFAATDSGKVEPWVKVITSNDIEGWSRLFYLSTDEYKDIEFHVSGQTEIIY